MARAVLRAAGMRLDAALALLLVCAAPGCALSHELTSGSDGGSATHDLGGVADLGSSADLGSASDGGDTRTCNERWSSLPYCPADPTMAIGQHCPMEGQICGGCCLPGPPLACTGGVWTERTTPPCMLLCPAIPACGTGRCAPGEVCLHVSTDFPQPDRCVTPPFGATTCGDVPSDWLTSDPRSCALCACDVRMFPIGPELNVTLDCPCCDGTAP